MKRAKKKAQYVICVCNKGCEDLTLRKVYEVLPDESAAKSDHIRVIDESGEDYLYPAACFIAVELSSAAAEAMAQAA